MAITFDAATSGGAAPASFNHTTSGSDRLLLVFVYTTNAEGTPAGVTYNGVAMTLIDFAANASTGRRGSLWYLINPASGTHAVVVDSTGLSNWRPVALSYAGCLQSGVPDSQHKTANTGSSTSRTDTTMVVATGCWLLMGVVNDNVPATGGAGTTERVANNVIDTLDSNGSVGTGAQSLVANVGVSSEWASIIVSFAPSAAAAATGNMLEVF